MEWPATRWRRLERQLLEMRWLLSRLLKRGWDMSIDLTKLRQEVADEKDVLVAVEKAFAGLTARIQALLDASTNTVDPDELQAIVDEFDATSAALAAAALANTPAAPLLPPPA